MPGSAENWTADQNRVDSGFRAGPDHPAAKSSKCFVWLNGSDNPPPAEIESGYLNIEKELEWPKSGRLVRLRTEAAVSGASA